MKILVLNGSPTTNGNTVALVNAFKEGAESKGHEVNVIDGRQKFQTSNSIKNRRYI